jgi:hypothetical protein
MKNDQLLAQISEYCRQAGMAESTFGRRAVNDGKLVHRLREGKRITVDTLERIQAFSAMACRSSPCRNRRSRSAIPPAISVFRKPAEVLAVRAHLLGKAGDHDRVALELGAFIRVRQPCGCSTRVWATAP